MKKRRIEITVSRRRTTIHLRQKPAGDTVEPTHHQDAAWPALAANLSPKEAELLQPEATQLPRAMLALTNRESENPVSEVEPETE